MKRYSRHIITIILTSYVLIVGGRAPVTAQNNDRQTIETSTENIFFADVIVRGNPVFQMGGLTDISARERVNIINRRIASVLSQSSALQPVEIQFTQQENSALLKVNNRVLMTVISQDALDFNLTVAELSEIWAEELNQSLVKPSLAVDVAQRLQGTTRTLIRDTIDNLPSFLGALIVILLTWLMAIAVRKIAMIWAEQTEGDRSTEILISRLCYGAVWVVGSIISLGILGLDFGLLLGTLGLTSVAIGFSLKDILSNYISGVILLAARPFRIQDQVIIGDYEGTVIQIQLRAITLQTYDGRSVYIPNQQVFQNSIVNITISPIRRSKVVVGIDYNANLDEVKEILYTTVAKIDSIETQPAPLILVSDLGASTVNVEVLFWVNSRRQSFLIVTSDLTQAIKESLQEANIEMPTDIFTIVMQN